ncbi:hypothetical protein ACVDHH_01135 [Staphylococcus saprophyticus]
MSNQVMELNRAQMEQMVRQANSALQMYDKIIEVEQRVIKTENRINQTAEKTERRLHKIETSYPMLDTEGRPFAINGNDKSPPIYKSIFWRRSITRALYEEIWSFN